MKFYVKTKLSENISETPEGYLLCRNVPLTHTGKLIYVKGEHPFDDIDELTVTRSIDELFSDKTLSSFEGKSITIKHPNEFVTPETWQELTNGTMMNVRQASEKIEVDGELQDVLLADFLITTSEAIKKVKSGLREVSLGYDSLWVQTGENTAVHTKIVGNHCALVDEGRAGITCAINDHKRGIAMDLKEKFKKLFGKTIDEAVAEKEKEADKEAKDSDSEKDQKIKDLEAKVKDLESKKEDESKDADEEESDEDKKKKEDESKDEGDIESRVGALEESIKKILNLLEGESEEVVADEEATDAEEEDEGKEAKSNDTMAKAEILSPGITETKDVKKKALEAAYKTTDGKKVIETLTGGKAPSYKTEAEVNMLFNTTAELLKSKRVDKFASARAVTIDSFPSLKNASAVTAEDINKKNEEHYSSKQK